jgi:hypothetical protein
MNSNILSQAIIGEGTVYTVEIRQEVHDPCTFPPPPAALGPPALSVNPHHRIRFRHPHYPNSSNVLITLFAPDIPTGGIEYGVAHTSCGIITGNRWNGWFTLTVEGPALTLTYGNILCERDYYFHLPESSIEAPYAIVPTFKQWEFPHNNLHPCWYSNQDHKPSAYERFAVPSSLSEAIHHRDQSCRMSGFTEGTQAAQLCPKSEEVWFHHNQMSRYNLNPLLVATRSLEDTANALLLRQDLYSHFNAHKFIFVPKKRTGDEDVPIVTHLLVASRELGTLHHNVRLKEIQDVDISFLFTRFAWTIFTFLAGFLEVGVDRTLIGTTISAPAGLPRVFTGANCRSLLSESKSRIQSSPKSLRRRFDKKVEEEADGSEQEYKRQKKDFTVVETAHCDVSQDTEELRESWLKIERSRSDIGNTWLEESTWARHIRSNDLVMGPAESLRLYQFLGHEVRDDDLEADDAAK